MPHEDASCWLSLVVKCGSGELLEKWSATGRCIPRLLNIRLSVKRLYGHETVIILMLLPEVTEAESAELDFLYHLTRELGKSIFGNEDIVLTPLSVGK